MQLIHKLFNVTIVAADGEVPVWDPSVSFWKVYRDGALKGYLYIDPYARAGGELHHAPDWSTQMARLIAVSNPLFRLYCHTEKAHIRCIEQHLSGRWISGVAEIVCQIGRDAL